MGGRFVEVHTTVAAAEALLDVSFRHVRHSAGNLQAVASFLGQYYSPEDFATFEARFGLPDVPIARTFGANNPGQRPRVEASLDVQYLLGVGNCSVETWVFSTPGETPSRNEPFFKWLVGLNNLTTGDTRASPPPHRSQSQATH